MCCHCSLNSFSTGSLRVPATKGCAEGVMGLGLSETKLGRRLASRA